MFRKPINNKRHPIPHNIPIIIKKQGTNSHILSKQKLPTKLAQHLK